MQVATPSGVAPKVEAAGRDVDILIVGAGFGGLIMALEARRRGFEDIVILEKADAVGGCWRANTYPGVACDIPSHLYSIASQPYAHWSRTFAPGGEILGYLQTVAKRERLERHILFNREMTGADWDADARVWHVTTGMGERFRTRVLVAATGALHVPKRPDIPGLDEFAGPVMHSAEWDHHVDLTGKRVAVIGTGASAAQFAPEVAKAASALTVYQRTASWVLPRADEPTRAWHRWAYAHMPGARRVRRSLYMLGRERTHRVFRGDRGAVRMAEGWGLASMRRSISDADLRAKLTPSHRIGCKRIILSDDWYPMLARPNVDLVTERIAEIRPRAVVTADGVARPADALLLGTGFQATGLAPPVRGVDGRPLAEAWTEGMAAHLGASAPGFPNFFMLLGPNTGLGHNSVVLMIEAQVEHVLNVLSEARDWGAGAVEVRPEPYDSFVSEVRTRLDGMVWRRGGCSSWYQDAEGRVTTLWPGTVREFRRRARASDFLDYRQV